MYSELPAELRFIASTVQPDPNLAQIEALVTGDLDWDRVVHEAVTRHKVGRLVYRNVTETTAKELVPGRIIDRFGQQSQQTAMRNLSLTNSLKSISGQLNEQGIPMLPYKGPVLSESIYGDFSLRQSRDLDILVRPDDLADAEAVLLEHGFEPRRDLTIRQKRRLARTGRNRTMKKAGLIVDLHPRISRIDPPFEVGSLIDRAGSVNLDGDTLPAITPIDNLLVLSVHGSRHKWQQLKWVCDIAYLVRNKTFDWSMVLEESRRRDCYRRVLLGLGLAGAVFDVELPTVIRSRLGDVNPWLLEHTYPACLLNKIDETSLHYRLRCRDDTADRIRYTWSKLTTPPVKDVAGVSEPSSTLHRIRYVIESLSSKSRVVTRSLASRVRAKI